MNWIKKTLVHNFPFTELLSARLYGCSFLPCTNYFSIKDIFSYHHVHILCFMRTKEMKVGRLDNHFPLAIFFLYFWEGEDKFIHLMCLFGQFTIQPIIIIIVVVVVKGWSTSNPPFSGGDKTLNIFHNSKMLFPRSLPFVFYLFWWKCEKNFEEVT